MLKRLGVYSELGSSNSDGFGCRAVELKRPGEYMPKLGSDDSVRFVCRVAVQSSRLVKQQSSRVEKVCCMYAELGFPVL